MFKELFNTRQDERSVIVTGRCATVFLGITQILLLLALLRRRYLLLAGSVIGGCLLFLGIPEPSDWANTWLPALLGPAILIGLYSLAAHLGKRRIERMMKAED